MPFPAGVRCVQNQHRSSESSRLLAGAWEWDVLGLGSVPTVWSVKIRLQRSRGSVQLTRWLRGAPINRINVQYEGIGGPIARVVSLGTIAICVSTPVIGHR